MVERFRLRSENEIVSGVAHEFLSSLGPDDTVISIGSCPQIKNFFRRLPEWTSIKMNNINCDGNRAFDIVTYTFVAKNGVRRFVNLYPEKNGHLRRLPPENGRVSSGGAGVLMKTVWDEIEGEKHALVVDTPGWAVPLVETGILDGQGAPRELLVRVYGGEDAFMQIASHPHYEFRNLDRSKHSVLCHLTRTG